MDLAFATSVREVSAILVCGYHKSGGTGIIPFAKTSQKLIKQGYDELGIGSWMTFEEEDNIESY